MKDGWIPEEQIGGIVLKFIRGGGVACSLSLLRGFPGSSDGNVSACSTGDLGLTPGLGKFPGERNGNPPGYSYLTNSRDRGAWQATVDTTEQLPCTHCAKSQSSLVDETLGKIYDN